jgi:hypothetical protein
MCIAGVAIVLFIGLAVAAVVHAYKKAKERDPTAAAKMRHFGAAASLKFKLVLAYYQIVGLLGAVFEVPFPQFYTDWVASLSFFTFDLFAMVPFRCILSNFSFHSQMYATSIMGLVLQVLVVCLYGLRVFRSKQMKSGLGWVMILLYLFYPSITSVAFETFNCNDLGDIGNYLKADYEVNCSSTEHIAAKRMAWGVIAVFAIGTPIGWAVMMFRDRNAKFLRFFCSSYHPQYYYWECIEIVKKLLLVGFAVMFKQGSIVQLVCGMLVALFYLVLLLWCSPYNAGTALVNTSSLMLVLSLFGALLIKVASGTNGSVYEEGYTTDFISGLMLCFNAAILMQVAAETLLSAYEAWTHIPLADNTTTTSVESPPACSSAISSADSVNQNLKDRAVVATSNLETHAEADVKEETQNQTNDGDEEAENKLNIAPVNSRIVV